MSNVRLAFLPFTTSDVLAGTSQRAPLRVSSMIGGSACRSNVTSPVFVAKTAPVLFSKLTCTVAVYVPGGSLRVKLQKNTSSKLS